MTRTALRYKLGLQIILVRFESKTRTGGNRQMAVLHLGRFGRRHLLHVPRGPTQCTLGTIEVEDCRSKVCEARQSTRLPTLCSATGVRVTMA